jgi:hypothetical protein
MWVHVIPQAWPFPQQEILLFLEACIASWKAIIASIVLSHQVHNILTPVLTQTVLQPSLHCIWDGAYTVVTSDKLDSIQPMVLLVITTNQVVWESRTQSSAGSRGFNECAGFECATFGQVLSLSWILCCFLCHSCAFCYVLAFKAWWKSSCQGAKSDIFCGPRSAAFCLPFENNLLTWLHLELALIHSTIHEECIELTTLFSLMISWLGYSKRETKNKSLVGCQFNGNTCD